MIDNVTKPFNHVGIIYNNATGKPIDASGIKRQEIYATNNIS
jgi:hypothetical protein